MKYANIIFGDAAYTRKVSGGSFPQHTSALNLHLTEIGNYFRNRTTSGVTEGLNTRIKLILRQSYGFKNFDMMREKLLVCLSLCREESRLISLIVDYWINQNSISNNIDFWIEKVIVKFKTYDISDSLKGELFAMTRIFPVNKLINLTRRFFPIRKETPFSILLMLRKCNYYVEVVLSEDDDLNYDRLDNGADRIKDDNLYRHWLASKTLDRIKHNNLYRDWLASKTLDRIKHEILFLKSIPKGYF